METQPETTSSLQQETGSLLSSNRELAVLYAIAGQLNRKVDVQEELQEGLAIQRARLSAERTSAATRLATIEERNRLAREIHDTLAQGLAAITLQLETADALATVRPERAQEAIRRALGLARSNLEEARRSVIDLRAAPLQDRTLPEALAALARETAQEGIEIDYRYS